MGCNCNSLPPEYSLGRLGDEAMDPCDNPLYWVVQKGADGKCYNVCLVGEMAHEVDASFCAGAATTTSTSAGFDLNLSDTQIIVFALGAVLLVTFMSNR